jgi:Co/Zn/Cd efflux system component
VLAIAALLLAMYFGWTWADPLVGILGSLVIGSWAYGLIRDSGSVLLDASTDKNLETIIRERIETKVTASPTFTCGRWDQDIAPQ